MLFRDARSQPDAPRELRMYILPPKYKVEITTRLSGRQPQILLTAVLHHSILQLQQQIKVAVA